MGGRSIISSGAQHPTSWPIPAHSSSSRASLDEFRRKGADIEAAAQRVGAAALNTKSANSTPAVKICDLGWHSRETTLPQ
jgi:hypothetical protein